MAFRHKEIIFSIIVVSFYVIKDVSSQNCSMTKPCSPLKGGAAFKQPQAVRSVGGKLQTSLVVDISTFQVDWLSVQRRLYNETFPGPTLRIKPGDKIDLELVNYLTEPDYDSSEENTFSFPNTTNLHTHGLHISSKIPQDNVFIRVNPGETFTYTYEIDPSQPAGTYFYHSHLHRAGFFQVFGGLAGMIVVEDFPNSIPSELNLVSCPDHCENEVHLVLQGFQYSSVDDGDFASVQRDIHDSELFRLNSITIEKSSLTLEDWLEDPKNEIQYFLVNGILRPTMTMEAGQTKRFRILNAGGLHSLAVHITSDSGQTPCDVVEIAADGLYLDKPRQPKTGRSFLTSAGRVDWLVKCTSSGIFELRSSFTAEDNRSLGDHPTFSGLLMTIKVLQSAITSSFPQTLPPLPSFLPDLLSINENKIGGRFAVEVTGTDTLNRENYIENYVRYRMKVNTVQEMILTNTEYETSHPIHMHVNSFQVVSYNRYTGPYAVDDGEAGWALFNQNNTVCKWQHKSYDENIFLAAPENPLKYLGHENEQGASNSIGYVKVGDRRDTILVPPLSNITVRFVADKYTGEVVIHCHLLPDADQGMMMITEIVEEDESTAANETSSGSYPWSCFENDPIPQPQCCGASSMFQKKYVLLLFAMYCLTSLIAFH